LRAKYKSKKKNFSAEKTRGVARILLLAPSTYRLCRRHPAGLIYRLLRVEVRVLQKKMDPKRKERKSENINFTMMCSNNLVLSHFKED
jgi:hypothetical protein